MYKNWRNWLWMVGGGVYGGFNKPRSTDYRRYMEVLSKLVKEKAVYKETIRDLWQVMGFLAGQLGATAETLGHCPHIGRDEVMSVLYAYSAEINSCQSALSGLLDLPASHNKAVSIRRMMVLASQDVYRSALRQLDVVSGKDQEVQNAETTEV